MIGFQIGKGYDELDYLVIKSLKRFEINELKKKFKGLKIVKYLWIMAVAYNIEMMN